MNTHESDAAWYLSELMTILTNMAKTISFEAVVLICIIFAIYQYIGDREKQYKAKVASQQRKYIRDIVLHLPSNIYESAFELDRVDAEQQEQILRLMRAYFDIAYDCNMLYKNKQLSKKDWLAIKTDLEYALTKPAFQDAWYTLNQTRGYQAKFANFIRKFIEKTNKKLKVEPVQTTAMLDVDVDEIKY